MRSLRNSFFERWSSIGANSPASVGSAAAIVASVQGLPTRNASVYSARTGVAATPP